MATMMIRDETTWDIPGETAQTTQEEARPAVGARHDLANQGMLWLGRRSLDPLDVLRRGEPGRK